MFLNICIYKIWRQKTESKKRKGRTSLDTLEIIKFKRLAKKERLVSFCLCGGMGWGRFTPSLNPSEKQLSVW